MKKCTRCKKLINLKDFHLKYGKPIVVCKYCCRVDMRKRYLKNRDFIRNRAKEYRLKNKDVINAKQREYVKNPERREANINRSLLRNYGITLVFKNELLNLQKGKCAICDIDIRNENAFVDHNHSTGKIRGILCKHCNSAIGLLKENLTIMQNAITYLNENQF